MIRSGLPNHVIEERQDVIFRRVRGILNKITPETFDKLSKELVNVGLDSPITLRGVIYLLFDKALKDVKYSSLYAKLCQELSEKAPNFEHEPGPNTFCKFLISKCEDEFERRRKATEVFDCKKELTEEEHEQRAIVKQKMLGNIKFICELGKKRLLQEEILHECIRGLLSKKKERSLQDQAQDLECLCQIMRTIGSLLDGQASKNLMNQYFDRIEMFSKKPELPSRIRFMLRDVIDLRNNKWRPRPFQREDHVPLPLSKIRDEAGINQILGATSDHRFGSTKDIIKLSDLTKLHGDKLKFLLDDEPGFTTNTDIHWEADFSPIEKSFDDFVSSRPNPKPQPSSQLSGKPHLMTDNCVTFKDSPFKREMKAEPTSNLKLTRGLNDTGPKVNPESRRNLDNGPINGRRFINNPGHDNKTVIMRLDRDFYHQHPRTRNNVPHNGPSKLNIYDDKHQNPPRRFIEPRNGPPGGPPPGAWPGNMSPTFRRPIPRRPYENDARQHPSYRSSTRTESGQDASIEPFRGSNPVNGPPRDAYSMRETTSNSLNSHPLLDRPTTHLSMSGDPFRRPSGHINNNNNDTVVKQSYQPPHEPGSVIMRSDRDHLQNSRNRTQMAQSGPPRLAGRDSMPRRLLDQRPAPSSNNPSEGNVSPPFRRNIQRRPHETSENASSSRPHLHDKSRPTPDYRQEQHKDQPRRQITSMIQPHQMREAIPIKREPNPESVVSFPRPKQDFNRNNHANERRAMNLNQGENRPQVVNEDRDPPFSHPNNRNRPPASYNSPPRMMSREEKLGEVGSRRILDQRTSHVPNTNLRQGNVSPTPRQSANRRRPFDNNESLPPRHLPPSFQSHSQNSQKENQQSQQTNPAQTSQSAILQKPPQKLGDASNFSLRPSHNLMGRSTLQNVVSRSESASSDLASKVKDDSPTSTQETILAHASAVTNRNFISIAQNDQNGTPNNSTKEPNPKTTAKDECIAKFDGFVTSYLSNSSSISNQLSKVKELKVPKDSQSDCLVSAMKKSISKSEHDRDLVSKFFTYLIPASFDPSSVLPAFKSLFEEMHGMEVETPKVKSIVAGQLAQAIYDNLVSLDEVGSILSGGRHHPLFLLCLQKLEKFAGQAWLSDKFTNSNVNTIEMLPEVDRSKDRLATILKDRCLGFLDPMLTIEPDLWDQMRDKDSSPASIYRWIKDNIDQTIQSTTTFAHVFIRCILKYIHQKNAEKSIQEISEKGSSDSNENLEKLSPLSSASGNSDIEEMLTRYQQVLQAIFRDKHMQLASLYALQSFYHGLDFPKGNLLRWFNTLYDLNIVDDDVFFTWKEEIKDDVPGKGQALFQVNTWLNWLAEAESEDDEEGAEEGENQSDIEQQ